MANRFCKPGTGKLPGCYQAPAPKEIAAIISMIGIAWDEGRYVVVVEGDEFSL
jgi:hypothetical protein